MTIECTSAQKELLMEIFLSAHICLQEIPPDQVDCDDDCKECLSRNIEWEIYDEGGEEDETI